MCDWIIKAMHFSWYILPQSYSKVVWMMISLSSSVCCIEFGDALNEIKSGRQALLFASEDDGHEWCGSQEKKREIRDHDREVWASGFWRSKQIIAKACKNVAWSFWASLSGDVMYWWQSESETVLKIPKLKPCGAVDYMWIKTNSSHKKKPYVSHVVWLFLDFFKKF